MGFWSGRKALVTGGASFIGSSLVEQLLERGAEVRVVDDFSSGERENLASLRDHVDLVEADLRDVDVTRRSMQGIDVVFHNAANHGGRGYVELHQAGPASNLYLDGLVFYEALQARVGKVVFASSGCVYPNALQADPGEEIYLREPDVRPPYDADNLYGWAKLMGELTLRAYADEHGLPTASCRYFTAYGPRGLESHAVIAMIARAMIRQDPFEVWGDGQQIRNWTYIDDIVEGTILAAEKIDDGTAVNLGTMERVRVIDAVHMITETVGYDPEIRLLPDMPTGPRNRVADNSLARELLGWTPGTRFADGLRRTIDWYFEARDPERARRMVAHSLTDR